VCDTLADQRDCAFTAASDTVSVPRGTTEKLTPSLKPQDHVPSPVVRHNTIRYKPSDLRKRRDLVFRTWWILLPLSRCNGDPSIAGGPLSGRASASTVALCSGGQNAVSPFLKVQVLSFPTALHPEMRSPLLGGNFFFSSSSFGKEVSGFVLPASVLATFLFMGMRSHPLHDKGRCDPLHLSSPTRKKNGQKGYFTNFQVFCVSYDYPVPSTLIGHWQEQSVMFAVLQHFLKMGIRQNGSQQAWTTSGQGEGAAISVAAAINANILGE